MSQTSRNIPLFTSIHIILGRGLTTLGFCLFGFLMVFAWGFGGSADTSFWHFSGAQVTTTTGQIVEVVETNMSINDESVWANVYKYQDGLGHEHVNDAFTTGRPAKLNGAVTVEYVTDAPEHGRIPGMRSAEFSQWMLLAFALPFIGVSLVALGLRRGIQDYQILKVGEMVKAKLIDKARTGSEINDQPVYKLTFEFSTKRSKKYTKVLKTHLTEKFEDEPFERIFYNPENPDMAVLVDDLAGSPTVGDDGELLGSGGLPLKPILWPIICTAPHIWYATSLL